eukprot:1009828-Pyramimonas_sp.AAC.1
MDKNADDECNKAEADPLWHVQKRVDHVVYIDTPIDREKEREQKQERDMCASLHDVAAIWGSSSAERRSPVP